MELKNKNYNISIILPVINETFSLEKTVKIIFEKNNSCIKECIIVLSKSKSSAKSKATCDKLKIIYSDKIKIFYQDIPFLGGAIRKGFEKALGTHVLMMASDLETNPEDVKKMIEISKINSNSIITANRWHYNKGFEGYNFVKLILNFIFQFICKILFFTNLRDITFGFRIFPNNLVKEINWTELKHPFLLETILIPLKLKINIIEVNSSWKKREEGLSQNNFFQNFDYFRVLFKVRFMSLSSIKRK